jgi:hypothetical protein
MPGSSARFGLVRERRFRQRVDPPFLPLWRKLWGESVLRYEIPGLGEDQMRGVWEDGINCESERDLGKGN